MAFFLGKTKVFFFLCNAPGLFFLRKSMVLSFLQKKMPFPLSCKTTVLFFSRFFLFLGFHEVINLGIDPVQDLNWVSRILRIVSVHKNWLIHSRLAI